RIERSLRQVHFALVLIGQRWCDVTDEHGRRRLDATDDMLRFEIAAALRLKKTVIPILLGGAKLPDAETLPAEVRPMLERHALVMGSESWEADKKELFKVLDPLKPIPPFARWVPIGTVTAALIVLATHYFWRPQLAPRHPAIVPSVTGRPYGEAQRILQKDRFTLGQLRPASGSGLTPGIVIAQSPLAGTQELQGTPVNVDVVGAEGVTPATAPTPSLTGLEPAAARSIIQLSGFQVGEISYAVGEPVGRVLHQSPAAGATGKKGGEVSLVIASAPAAPSVLVPRVRGRPLQFARQQLEHKGLRVEMIQVATWDST